MATIRRRVTEVVEVVQEPRNGRYITMFDVAEFGSDCADAKLPGDTGVQARCTDDGAVVKLRAVVEFVTRDDDRTDPQAQMLDAERPG